jgi:hypothetical protein
VCPITSSLRAQERAALPDPIQNTHHIQTEHSSNFSGAIHVQTVKVVYSLVRKEVVQAT